MLCFIHSTKILFGSEMDIGLKPCHPNWDLILCHLLHLGNIHKTGTDVHVGSKMFRVSMQLESFPYLVIRDKSLKPYNKDVFINPKTL